MIKVIISHNSKPIKTYQFNKEAISLGRLATNDIPINSMAVSRNHLLIEDLTAENKVRVTDRESLNGTLLNNQKISSVEIDQPSYFAIGEFGIFIDIPANQAPVQPQVAAAPAQNVEPAALVETVSHEVTTDPGETSTELIFKAGDKSAEEEEAPVEKIDHSKAVLIELGKQIIYKINKSRMTFGNAKNNDIYIEGGVFSTDRIATLHVRDTEYELVASNKLMGRFKVNGKKVSQCILKHKDKIDIGSSSFSFMLKEE